MNKLRKTFEDHMSLIAKAVDAFPWHDQEAYAQWLAQTYHYVKFSTRLLTAAATYIPQEDLDLHNRFIDHSKEERAHELLCVNDLRFLKRSIENYEESIEAASMYQSQFFWIQYRGPASFFGYILFLEGVGSRHCAEMYKRSTEAHGARAGVFLKVHSDEDQDHIIKAFDQIEKFDESTQSLIIENFVQTSKMYCKLLEYCAYASKNINYEMSAS